MKVSTIRRNVAMLTTIIAPTAVADLVPRQPSAATIKNMREYLAGRPVILTGRTPAAQRACQDMLDGNGRHQP